MTLGAKASDGIPDSKVHGANMGPTWVLSAPDGSHVGPMNLAVRDDIEFQIPEYSGSAFCVQRYMIWPKS